MRLQGDLHAIEPEDFHEQVHSFEHWFDAVEDYLHGLEYGHLKDLRESGMTPDERDRLISTLCNYAVAETAALEASSGLIRIAPNRHAQIFLATQVADEGRHLEVILHRLRELGVHSPEATVKQRAGRSIQEFRQKLVHLVDAKEWDTAIFAQNVVLEAMEYVVFRTHAKTADPITRDLLERILRDERRHIGFGENEIGRRIRHDPRVRLWISRVKTELDHLALATFEGTLADLGIPPSERPAIGRDYLAAVGRLGV